jgi:transcription elongation factor Elf1
MQVFEEVRELINYRYKDFKPSYCYVKSESGLQMLIHLVKANVEILVGIDDIYPEIKIKIDTLIVVEKNRKKNHYCQCGYNLSRYDSFTKCKICGLESCSHCFYTGFKLNQGVIKCYKCGNHTSKKIKPLSTFNRIFNKVLTDYCSETGDDSLLELIHTEYET